MARTHRLQCRVEPGSGCLAVPGLGR